jgi:hypothetical protein
LAMRINERPLGALLTASLYYARPRPSWRRPVAKTIRSPVPTAHTHGRSTCGYGAEWPS